MTDTDTDPRTDEAAEAEQQITNAANQAALFARKLAATLSAIGGRPAALMVARLSPQDDDKLHRRVTVVDVDGSKDTYDSADSLTWETYGREENGVEDFTTDRQLEIFNSNGVVVASYQPATWLHVYYTDYRANDA